MKKILLVLVSAIILSSCGWIAEAEDVAQEEFGARGSLEKYEWFKDAAATLDEKMMTIRVYEGRMDDLKAEYKGIPMRDWNKVEKQQWYQWTMEVVGLKASYNKVVGEYNAQSSKFNWSVYNTSDLPVKYDLYFGD